MTVSCCRKNISLNDIRITFVVAVSSLSDGSPFLAEVTCRGSWAEDSCSSQKSLSPSDEASEASLGDVVMLAQNFTENGPILFTIPRAATARMIRFFSSAAPTNTAAAAAWEPGRFGKRWLYLSKFVEIECLPRPFCTRTLLFYTTHLKNR